MGVLPFAEEVPFLILFSLELLHSIVPSKEAVFYFCGPIPFMEAILKALNRWDVPNEQIHYEVFCPVAILGEK